MPRDDDGRDTLVVGLVADPGSPTEAAQKLSEQLPAMLRRHVSDRMRWRVEQRRSEILLDEQGFIPLISLAKEQPGDGGWDYVVYLTDLPRSHGNRAVPADLSIGQGVALGSNFDNDSAVRRATYGRRQRERQARSRAERERREQREDPSASRDAARD